MLAISEIFPWDDNFATGIEIIDEQHRRLVGLVNKLAMHMATDSGGMTVHQVLDELTDYTVYHFNAEEAIWLGHLPHEAITAKHQAIHQSFVDEINKARSDAARLSNADAINEILAFLTHWLAFHILDTDRHMAKIVLAMRNGASLQEATRQADHDMRGSARLLIEAVLKMYDSLSARTLDLMREILMRQHTEQRLQLSRSVIDSTLEAIFITDAHGLISDANPSFCADVQCSCAELTGRHIADIKPALFDQNGASAFWSEARDKGHWAGEIAGAGKDGITETVWLTLSAVMDADEKISHFAGVMSSISHLIERQHNLELEVNHDALTGLPNRRLLGDRLKQAIVHSQRNQKKLAVCFIDLDGFKTVNDTLGHAAGDTLLCEVSQRLKSMLRGEDTVARVGGDEFVLLVGDLIGDGDIEPLLERILQSLQEPVALNAQQARVSASIGITLHPTDPGTPDELLQHADEAMYAAKKGGKSRFNFWHAASACKPRQPAAPCCKLVPFRLDPACKGR